MCGNKTLDCHRHHLPTLVYVCVIMGTHIDADVIEGVEGNPWSRNL